MEDKNKQIEKIAWQVFLNKTGFCFRELTVDEKKSITDVKDYEYYRQEAAKIYEKKQKALQNKKYKVIEIPSDGNSGMYGGAFTLCFVYSKYDGNFVLSGYMREVEAFLEKNYTHYFYNLSLWHRGFNRDIWYFWKKNIGIFHPSRRDKRKGEKISIRQYHDYRGVVADKEEVREKTLTFKRLPKRWIPEFDKF